MACLPLFMNKILLLCCILVLPFLKGCNESTATEPSNDKCSISTDDWTALWTSIVTYLLDTTDSPLRTYDDEFIKQYFDETVATDFKGWTVRTIFGEQTWPNREAFLDGETGYVAYNKGVANNEEHSITIPTIISTDCSKALMYVNTLNRKIDRLDYDNSVPMWKTNLHWYYVDGKWRITEGISYYENP